MLAQQDLFEGSFQVTAWLWTTLLEIPLVWSIFNGGDHYGKSQYGILLTSACLVCTFWGFS